MDRRELLGLFGAGAAGLAALGAKEALADDEKKEHHEHHEHIKTIGECAMICNAAAHHCLEALCEGKENREHHAKTHELTMDCQDFCTMTAVLMARKSPLAAYAHQACAEACRCCAEACEKGEGKIMKACAEHCRKCEKVCREMATSAGRSSKVST